MQFSTLRYECFGARLGSEQKLLEVRLRQFLQSAPLFDRDKHRRLNTPLGNDLRSFDEACCQQFAEARLSILYLPDVAHKLLQLG